MPVVLHEESPMWTAIMRYLHDNGASSGKGCRVRQTDIADAVGLNRKNLWKYIKAMEQYQILTVRRTTVDGSFGSPRGFNIYTLHCTPERWTDELGPAVAQERRARYAAHRAVLNRNLAREQKRKRLKAKLEELGPEPGGPGGPVERPARATAVHAATRVVEAEPTFAAEELDAIVERYDDPAADLSGW